MKSLICGFLWVVLITLVLTGCVYTRCEHDTHKPIHIDLDQTDPFEEAYA